MRYSYRSIFLTLAFTLISQCAVAQFTLSGTVTDSRTGEAIIGANLFHEPTGSGTVTDTDGEFTITLPGQQAILRVTYIGYISRDIEVSEADQGIEIELEPDIARLEEVVVTGLASTIRRENLANSVSSIQAQDIAGRVNPQTLDRAMQGKIPGVKISSYSGAPGGGFNIQLRGVSTLGAGTSQPLIVVDGVYMDNSFLTTGRSTVSGAGNNVQDNSANRLADLNPEDIESIEILKGPSAAAIYGQRANAGVVIVQTKQGRAGDTQVSFKQDVGFSEALRLLGRTDWTEDRIITFWDGDESNGLNSAAQRELERFRTAQQNGTIRDLEKELYGETGSIVNTQISVSGGNEKTRFYVSGGLSDERGIIKNTGFERSSIRANLDHSITRNVRISSNSTYIATDTDRGFTGNQNNTGGSVGYSLSFHPNYAYGLLQPNDEGIYPDSDYFAENPFRLIDVAVNNQEVDRFMQSLSLNANLLQQSASLLSLSLRGGLDYMTASSMVYFPEFMQFQRSTSFPGDVSHSTQEILNLNFQGVLLFETQVSGGFGSIDFGTQVGLSRFDRDFSLERIRGQGLLPGQVNIANASQVTTAQNFTEVTDLGFFGQQEINWDDKLIATVGGRYDRSTLNLVQDEYYFYPKASLAANITNFGFWSMESVNQLKLRIAYGETGGLPAFGNTFQSLGNTNIGSRVGATAPDTGVDPDLKPERAKELEYGLDLTILDGHASFQATFYNKQVDDLILGLAPSPATGVDDDVTTNAAELENKGIELGLTLVPFRNNRFSWSSSLLWWKNESEITSLSIPAQTNNLLGFIGFGATRFEEGVSPTGLFGIDPNESGLVQIGDFQPDYQMSWSNNLVLFSNLEVGFNWHLSQGGDNINLSKLLSDGTGNSDDYWVNGTSINDRIALGLGSTNRWLEDASYLKLREASIYYNLPARLLENTLGAVRQVRVGVSGTNLLMFTDYDGYDPEVNFAGRDALGTSVSITPYPTSRQVLFHLKLDF